MSQALEESMRLYEEQNRSAPPDDNLLVSLTYCLLATAPVLIPLAMLAFKASGSCSMQHSAFSHV